MGVGDTDEIQLADSITKLDARHRGRVVVSGSHGGVYAGYCAAIGGVRAVILDDAGIGRDGAGIGSLAALDRIGLAAATADSMSCRIADAPDMLSSGLVSHVNATAAALGCRPGQRVADCADLMRAAAAPTGQPEPIEEARFVIRDQPGERVVIGIDSASLFRPDDAGRIVVTASHGGLIGGVEKSVTPGVFAAFFNDAGGCKDGSGRTRIGVLGERGTAAGTVSAASARIGDARSSYADGVLSAVNDLAGRLGGRVGMRLHDFVDRLAAQPDTQDRMTPR